jgi:hypothetical protein
MQAPVCADVTVRHWSDKLPNGVVTIFYGRPASYTVIGAPDDKPVLVQCLQHPLRYMLPDLIGGGDAARNGDHHPPPEWLPHPAQGRGCPRQGKSRR